MARSALVRRTLSGAAALTLALALVGCGNGDGDSSAIAPGGGLDSVTVTGKPGTSPTYEWSDRVEVTKTESTVATEGEGDLVKDGDVVLTHVSIANGYSKTEVYNDFKEPAQPVTAGSDLLPALDLALTDHTIGSRVVVAAPPKDAFGEQGNAQLGIGNEDSVVFVIDLVDLLPTELTGTEVEPKAWMPGVDQKDGVPASLDFTGTPKPTKALQVGELIAGDGPVIKKGQTIYAHYLGQVYGGKAPFDASYGTGTPLARPIGVGQLVKGWDQAIVGARVGSRLMIAVPPALGYGKQGNPDAGIKGTDTLYFLIDLLSAD